jgi:PTH1 family peptidyl-tRNA hydrolase
MPPIRLIVGLGNPGPRYTATRHNIGASCVRAFARRFGITLVHESKFKGEIGRGQIAGRDVRLLLPGTFMNLSGDCVGAVARFYKIEAAEILVAYDEVAFEPGVVKLKTAGGTNGHNGIRSVIAGLGNDPGFHRLRIGVGHPGDKDRLTAYLTTIRMPESERALAESACAISDAVMADLISADMNKAMNQLHAPGEN